MVSYFTNMVWLGDVSSAFEKVWNFFYTGGWSMVPILICSMAALTLIVFKFIELRREAVIPKDLEMKLEAVEALVQSGRLQEISRSLRGSDAVLTRICRHGLLTTHGSKEEAERSTEVMAREEVSRLERGIPGLEVIFTIAPLLGLIGTAGGLVTIFATFGGRAAGPEQTALIARGISEALNTTIAGLVVAVPAYIFQTYFARRLEALALRMSSLVTALLNAAYRPVSELPEPARPKVILPQSEVSQAAPELDADPASA
jgi:biopolymer transport protein ExbB